MARFPIPSSDPPKKEMQYFPDMTTALPSESGEFRRVLWTGLYSQLVLMTVPVDGDIGEEVHTVDQILTFTSGKGLAQVGGKEQEVKAGDMVIVPAGTKHQFLNTGPTPLILYTVYSPAEHKPTTVHETKEQGDREEEDGIDVAPAWSQRSKEQNGKEVTTAMQNTFLQLSFLASVASGYWLPETLGKDQFKTCVVPKTTGDASPTITSTVKSCGSNSRVVLSAGTEYTLLTPLKFSGLTNVEFSVEEQRTLVTGSPLPTARVSPSLGGAGYFNGHGDKWWSNKNDSSDNGRPHFFSFGVTGLRLRGMKVINPVAWVFSMGGQDVYMTDTLLDARSTNGFPFNTDGIDASASDVVIDGWTSWNGDDIINVSRPAVNVTMRNIKAYGTHGISVSCASGSGSQYLFENAEIHDSLLGARFKGSVGTTCNISDVTWRNMTIINTSYPIHFIEDYVDQEKGAAGKDASLAAYAKNFRWESITAHTSSSLKDGSCVGSPCWSSTLEETTKKSMYIICKDAAHCQDFHFSDITLVAADGSAGEMECVGLENDKTLGIPCTNGTLTTSK
ncbi:hypothetical protein CcaCcLH18_02164 [Colletotrichum camelliae]|nr:hypothetical protein CcaCcLH18_02164 [Colletotrichum camelliae]